MKVGNLALGYASWGFRETPLEKQLQITSGDGLDVLELGIHGHENDYLQLSCSDEQIEKVKSLFNKYNVKLLCASTGNDFTVESENDCLDALNNVKNVIVTASKLGIRYLRIFAGFSPLSEVKGERFDRLIKCLNEVYAFASDKGVIPVIETHGGVNAYSDGVEHFASISTDVDALKRIISLTPNVAVNFDPANVSAVGEKDLVNYYNQIKSVVKYFHFKDFKKTASGKLLPTYCGNGDVDYHKLLPLLCDKDAPALFEYENVEDVNDGLKKCLNCILSVDVSK